MARAIPVQNLQHIREVLEAAAVPDDCLTRAGRGQVDPGMDLMDHEREVDGLGREALLRGYRSRGPGCGRARNRSCCCAG